MKRFLFGFVALSLMILTACGGGGPEPIVESPLPDDGGGGGAGFSGTIFAPPGGDVANTVVIACFLEAGQCNSASPNTVGVNVTASGTTATFSLPSVASGTYYVVALRDVNGNGTYGDVGDYQGFYSLDGQNPTPLTPPIGDLNVQMSVLGGAPVPPTPPEGNDLSGTISAPPGGDVAQTEVVACFLEAGQCNVNSPNTKSVALSTAGATGSFTVPGLAAGQYIVAALKDIDGNGSFADAVDYFGCYNDGADCAAVTPPQTGLTVQMSAEAGTTPDPGTGGTGAITGNIVFPGARGASPAELRSEVGVQEVGVQNVLPNALDQAQLRMPTTTPEVTDAPTNRFVPGEVIVKFASDARLQSLSVQGVALQRRQALGVPKAALYGAAGLDERGTLELIDDLNARPDVIYAEPNYIKTALKTPNDTFYPFQWHYEAMNLPAAWDITDGTLGDVTVAVVDSGSLPHPDLQSTLVGGYDFISDPVNSGDGDGYDADPTDLSQDSVYHGAHVAGTVAAGTNNGSGVAGVSWGAKVLPVRALGVAGGSITDIVNGTLWAAGESVAGVPANANPAQVVNLSIGGGAPCSQFEQEAFNTLRSKGVVVVVAAGNENSDVGLSSPANCDGVIAVGATGPQNTRAPYSNYGTGIDVMAPGGDTEQTLSIGGETVVAGVFSTSRDDSTGEFDYYALQGTSMAAPHVAGLVALMLAQEPGLDPDTVLARLQAGATPLSASECNRPTGEECGAGLLDAAAVLSGTATPPDDPTDPQPPVTGSAVTFAAALYCIAECSSFDNTLSKGLEVSAEGLEALYRIDELVAGTYIAAAWQDLNGDQEVSDGEPFGYHPYNLTLVGGEVVERADIYLQPFTPQAMSQMTGDVGEVSAVVSKVLEQRAAQPSLQEVRGEFETFRDPMFEHALEHAEQLLRRGD